MRAPYFIFFLFFSLFNKYFLSVFFFFSQFYKNTTIYLYIYFFFFPHRKKHRNQLVRISYLTMSLPNLAAYKFSDCYS